MRKYFNFFEMIFLFHEHCLVLASPKWCFFSKFFLSFNDPAKKPLEVSIYFVKRFLKSHHFQETRVSSLVPIRKIVLKTKYLRTINCQIFRMTISSFITEVHIILATSLLICDLQYMIATSVMKELRPPTIKFPK